MKFFCRDEEQPYNLAFVGLPASGKSTFLARLLGATISRGNSDKRNDAKSYNLSFGSATTADECRRKSREAVEELWNTIRKSPDKEVRGKTTSKTDLTFTVKGRGIKGIRTVRTADVPGDIFRSDSENLADEEYLKSGIRRENIERFRREFNNLCPSCSGIIIIVAADKLDKANRQAIIRDVVNEVGDRNSSGEPIFKMVAVSKAASKICDGERKVFLKRIRTLERDLKRVTKTDQQIRCVAFDSLADLVKDGEGWRLPKDEQELAGLLPMGIVTPTDVIVELFEMERRLYQRRKLLTGLSLVAGALALVGAWVWQGLSADRSLYELSKGVNRIEEQSVLERYLTAPLVGRMCFPGRYHRQEAVSRWRRSVFDSETGTYYKNLHNEVTSLDERKSQLDRIEDPQSGLFRFVDPKDFAAKRDELNGKIGEVKMSWLMDVSNEVVRLRKTCDSLGDVAVVLPCDGMPSLTNELNDIVSRERVLFGKELCQLKGEQDLFSGLSPVTRQSSSEFLTDFAKREKFAYAKLQGRRDSAVQNALDSLSRLWVKSHPFFVKEIAEKMRPIVQSTARFKALEQLEGMSKAGIDELNSKARKYDDEYCEKVRSVDRLKICMDALANLKDHPSVEAQSKDGWCVRKTALRNQIDESQRAVEELGREINELSKRPEGQISKINGFLQAKSAELVREKIDEVEALSKQYVTQYRTASNCWAQLSESFLQFKSDHTKCKHCEGLLAKYQHEVYDIQGRQDGIAGYDDKEIESEINNEKSQSENLKKNYLDAWKYRVSADKETECYSKAADALCLLRKSRLHEESKRWIDEWYGEIECVKDNCGKGSSDADFARAKSLLQVKELYDERLGLEKTDWLGKLQEDWNKTQFDNVERVAGNKNPGDAIDCWNEYLGHTNDGTWEVFPDVAEKKIAVLAKTHAELLKARVKTICDQRLKDVTPSVFIEVTNTLDRIEKDYDKPKVPKDADLNNQIEEARKKTVDGLYDWHIARLQDCLDGLGKVGGGVVVTKWRQIEEIDKVLNRMYDEKAISGRLPVNGHRRFRERFVDATNRTYEMAFKVKSLKFRVQREDKKAMSFIPGFWFSLVKKDGGWPNIFKYDEKGSYKDDLKSLEIGMAADAQFVAYKGFDLGEPVSIKVDKGMEVDCGFGLAKGEGGKDANYVSLQLLDPSETPAVLLSPNPRRSFDVRKTLHYKDSFSHKFEYSNFELVIELMDNAVTDDFRVKGKAKDFLDSLAR